MNPLPNTGDICWDLAHTVPCSDQDELARLLKESGFADDPRAPGILETAREAFMELLWEPEA